MQMESVQSIALLIFITALSALFAYYHTYREPVDPTELPVCKPTLYMTTKDTLSTYLSELDKELIDASQETVDTIYHKKERVEALLTAIEED